MKKLLFSLMAVSALFMTACHKDPVQPSDGGGNQEEQIPTGDGVYNPGRHISTLVYDDNRAPEIWLWEDSKLVSINEDDYCGGYTPVSTFTYNGWRLAQTVTTGDMPATVRYTYSGDKLSSLNILSGGMQMAMADVQHTGDKITHIDIDIDDTFLQMIIGMINNGGFNFGDLFGKQLGASMGRMVDAATQGGKFSVSSTAFAADLEWNGDNVSRMVVTGQVVMGVTVEELQQVLPLDSVMGAMASLLAYISDGQELPLTVIINDTTDLLYDSHTNPMQGFLGKIDPSILSANNVTQLYNRGMMDADLTISIPYLGDRHIPYSMPLGDGIVQHFVYTYNAAGYPLTVEDDSGVMTIYSYTED